MTDSHDTEGTEGTDARASIDDEALRRVTAADPAGPPGPDSASSAETVAIRLSVDERLGEAGPASTTAHDEVASRRHARARNKRALWIPVAAAACAVALAAGVGFTAGRSNGGAQVVATEAFRLNTDSSGSSAPGAAPSIEMAPGASAALGAPQADSKLSMPYYGYSGRTVYTAGDGLSADAGKATAWAYDARAVDAKSTISALAKALGIKGAPVVANGTWVVGAQDGTGPMVSLMLDGMSNFYSYDPSADPRSCISVEPMPAPAASDAPLGVPSTPCPTVEPKRGPSADDAIAVAKGVMKDVGIDPAGFVWTGDDTSDTVLTYVTGAQVVDGQQTGAMWWISVAHGNRIANANGSLAPLVSLGTYDVVSAQEAVARLNDPVYSGFYGGPMPMMGDATAKSSRSEGVAEAGPAVAADGSAGSSDGSGGSGTTTTTSEPVAPTLPTEAPAPMTPGAKFGWPVASVVITKAQLGFAQYVQTNGAVVLIPTYQLSGDDGGVRSVVAVVNSSLDTSTE